MSAVVGNVGVRLVLERDLPPTALLQGPASIGKWTMVQYLADHHRIAAADRYMVADSLTIDRARHIQSFAHRAPNGFLKLVAVRLDDATVPALNALLKILEEPPPRVRFLLTSTTATLPTVMSRCRIFVMSRLTVAQLTSVLVGRGMTSGAAERAARASNGQVEPALRQQNLDPSKDNTLKVLRAIATGDKALFDSAFAEWSAADTDRLSLWLTEALTGRWRVFSEQDAFRLHCDRNRLLLISATLARFSRSRPQLGVRSALEPFVTR